MALTVKILYFLLAIQAVELEKRSRQGLRKRDRCKKKKSVEAKVLKLERVGVTSKLSLEFYNYFLPLELQSIINYLFGLACASQREKVERASIKV